MKRRAMGWLFWPVGLISTVLVYLIFLVARPFRGTGVGSRFIGRASLPWGRALVFGAGIKLDVVGELPKSGGPFMIVGNHSSRLDIPVMCVALRGMDFRFLALPKVFRTRILGGAMRLSGHIEIDADAKVASGRTFNSLGPNFARGQSIASFAEGERSLDGEIHEFQKTTFSAAIKYGVTVLPVRLWGVFEVLPKGSKQPKSGRVLVRIGEPIPTEGLARTDAGKLARQVEEWIATTTHPSLESEKG